MDLAQLRGFLAVAEARNFTRAAAAMGVSQPALSRSIQRLEATLGQPLFERGSGGAELTHAGAEFEGRARFVVSTLEQAIVEFSDEPDKGVVRVAAIPTIAPYFLPALLLEFSKEFPRAQVVVMEETTDRLVDLVKHGEADVAVAAAPIEEKHLSVEPIAVEALRLVMPAEHELASRESLTFADVEEHPFVLLQEAHCLASGVTSFCNRQGASPLVVERVNQMVMVLELVALSHGVSFVPEMVCRQDESSRRVYRELDGEQPRRELVAIHNPYRYESKIALAFRDRLRDYASRVV